MAERKEEYFVRPFICSSACLEFEKCRYSGEVIPNSIVRQLTQFADFCVVCPETEIGLGIPRSAVRIIKDRETLKMIQPATGADCTDKMIEFSESFLNSINVPDGFILKHKSPTCGIKGVKIYNSANSYNFSKGKGLFADLAMQKFGSAIFEDEGRLSNFTIRDHFFIRIFAMAHLKSIYIEKSFSGLVKYHTDYKYLIMGYSQAGLKRLGKIIASGSKKCFENTYSQYFNEFIKVFSKPASFKSMINAIQHMYGYFSKELSGAEKINFLNLIEEYRDERIPLSVLIEIIKSWAIRFNQEYILNQKLLRPYPVKLMKITDSGKGRNL